MTFQTGSGKNVKGLEALRRRLPEIAALGANIVWLQPITTPNKEGHGYDVVNFTEIWTELGTEKDLKALVGEAHRRGIRIMLDVVLNHSSYEHPFVKDVAQKGKASAYYHFYQHEAPADVPYASYFNTKKIGKADFVFYFWEHLLNFNFSNKSLRDYLLGVVEFWVKEFDIDGYRFDASWAPSSRYPRFYREVSRHVRNIKPEIILMAEDRAGYPLAYVGTDHPHLAGSGFDWAYDWDPQDPYHISKWSFSTDPDAGETVFNLENAKWAAKYFVEALEHGHSKQGVKTLRYTENNDTPGLLNTHRPEQARWAQAVKFTLPGVPLIFYGEEVGNAHAVFNLPSFDPDRSMRSLNPRLWDYQQKLTMIRRSSEALAEGEIADVKFESPVVVSFVRRSKNERVKVKIHFEGRKVFVGEQELTGLY